MVVMDNLRAHKVPGVAEATVGRGAKLCTIAAFAVLRTRPAGHAHLVAATPHAPWLEVLYAPQEASVFTEEPQVVDGMLAVPQGPGLGLEIDLDVLSRYRVA